MGPQRKRPGRMAVSMSMKLEHGAPASRSWGSLLHAIGKLIGRQLWSCMDVWAPAEKTYYCVPATLSAYMPPVDAYTSASPATASTKQQSSQKRYRSRLYKMAAQIGRQATTECCGCEAWFSAFRLLRSHFDSHYGHSIMNLPEWLCAHGH
eukprot:jgi/Ulvmu1/5126/UM021_0143.1